ncbi:uncharacterized protein BX663DRAFT_499866 [Cokeromyces recurvatus]|uniref:uncharacterized protein n=1 Tax=Cokeromyces recurvatus TaxID=90255 RepID=UPI00221E778D|nr:uncharacterized protein BX663DRAFT_499866 [Cokeromyces recurvatus]KAI7905481.1 hypothetical protein BX663DRAFT_499866 [Cokeromyces recurvatus]
MTESETNDTETIVILSDEEDVVINENGKRLYPEGKLEENIEDDHYYSSGVDSKGDLDDDDDDDDDEEEEYNSDEDYEEELSIHKVRTLPDDHEPVILDERTADNPLKELNDIFTEFKSECIQPDSFLEDFDNSFACGGSLNNEAPNIAINIEGILGPIVFPLEEKEAERILSTFPTEKDLNEKITGLEIETSKIMVNLSFQEYLNDTVLSNILNNFGVPSYVAKNSRLQAYRLYIRTNGGTLKSLESLPTGAYGTVFVILPSEFNGGSISATWIDDEIKFRPESSAFECPYYVAWFNDVDIKFHPITYGYQLVIAFALIYDGDEGKSITVENLKYGQLTTGNISLSHIDQGKVNSYINRAVTYFENHKDARYPIFYMLDYRYMMDYIEIDNLKKSDRLLTEVFTLATEKAGYQMYFGLIQRDVEASVTNLVDMSSSFNGKEANECSIDEEGIYLTTNTIYDRYTLLYLIDNQGNNLLEDPIEFNQREHPVIIQGPSWYSRCKPERQDYRKDNSTVTYVYSIVSVNIKKKCSYYNRSFNYFFFF